ncbi:MAG TPA: carbohydrate kinase family protein [Candidatus Hydrogenedentes bacterium]|nr:carbohydrate kinase family protein [Candidatus Hydrogenedentota bacterium]
MRIAVLGAVVHDDIFWTDGSHREGFGGILYTAAALASVLSDGDEAVPVSRVGLDRYEAVLAKFAEFPHMATNGLIPCDEPMTNVTLTYRSAATRNEAMRNRMPPFDLDTLEHALDCDAVHVNPITGGEIDVATLRAFRECYAGLLSFDVHNMISSFDYAGTGKRSIVGFRQWREWAPSLDVFQCNEHEINTMFDHDVSTRADYALAAKAVCETGPRVATITLGPEGAVMVHRKNGACYCVDIGVLPPVEAIDTTGCGDSFSAGFLVGMLRYDDPVAALAVASVVAGVNARCNGLGELAEAKPLLENPKAHFSVFEGKSQDWAGVIV